MKVMFIDESGCLGDLPLNNSAIQPVLVVVGLVVDGDRIHPLTRDWMSLKRKWFPNLCGKAAKPLDWQTAEVKGSDVRRNLRSARRTERRHATGFVDHSLKLLEHHGARYGARVWIKEPGQRFGGAAAYAFSIQRLCLDLEHIAAPRREHGLVIADSRRPGPNQIVSHSVFTQRYRSAGDPYPSLVEVPVFGHSNNHAGLQLADLIASSLLFPICAMHFLGERVRNDHVHERFGSVAERFCGPLRDLQYRYGPLTKRCGGLVVSDRFTGRGAGSLFRRYAPALRPEAAVLESAQKPEEVARHLHAAGLPSGLEAAPTNLSHPAEPHLRDPSSRV